MTGLPERAPPELEPGVTLDSLTTVEACDAALDRLTMSITSIEVQLKRPASADPSGDWRTRAKQALRIKGFLMPRLQERRADLKPLARQQGIEAQKQVAKEVTQKKRRTLLGLAWDTEPEAMRRVEALARERHPDLFDEGEAA